MFAGEMVLVSICKALSSTLFQETLYAPSLTGESSELKCLIMSELR